MQMKLSQTARLKTKGYETGGKNVGGHLLMLPHGSPALECYIDDCGVPTIGWGHTGLDVHVGMTITLDEAEHLFEQDIGKFEANVNRVVTSPTTQNQFDALVDMAYNAGEGALDGSTLLKYHNKGRYDLAANQFPLWNKGHINGKLVVISGLTKRRAEERLIYETPDPVMGVTYIETNATADAVQPVAPTAPVQLELPQPAPAPAPVTTTAMPISDVNLSRRVTPEAPMPVRKMPTTIAALASLLPAGGLSVQAISTATETVKQIKDNADQVQQLAWLSSALGILIFLLATFVIFRKLVDRRNGDK